MSPKSYSSTFNTICSSVQNIKYQETAWMLGYPTHGSCKHPARALIAPHTGINRLPNSEPKVEPHTAQAPSTALQGSPPGHEPSVVTGHSSMERVARVFAEYIIHIFGSVRYPYPSPHSAWQKTLSEYIKSVLVSSALPISVVCSAMTLLLRYKNTVPYSVAYNDDAARLFLSAYIVAAKVGSDPPPSVRWWWRVGEGRFDCAEIMRMEVELCRTLRWNVQIDIAAFTWFRSLIRSSHLREGEYVGHGDGMSTVGTSRQSGRSETDLMMDDDAGGTWEGGSDHLNYNLNPPPPAYEDAPSDPRVLEVVPQQSRASPYTSTISISRRTHEDDEDYLRLARMFASSPSPPPSRMGSLRRSGAQVQQAPVEVRSMDRGGKSILTVVREKVMQIIRGSPLRGPG